MISEATVIVHDEIVRAKLLAAQPRILATNRALVTAMLEQIRPMVSAATPTGPGHFGYHGRDTLRIEVGSRGMRTTGKLMGAAQLYWREYGTRGAFRGGKAKLSARQSRSAGGFVGGEPATMTAHKALGAVRRLITFYYGGMANWWRL